MLEIKVEGDLFDENAERFITVKPTILHLEHSLLSISKWEQKYHKAFLSDREKTTEEMLYYIKCMTITKNVQEEVYKVLSEENYSDIEEYMNNPMTAAWFWDDDKKGKSTPTPSEVLYSRMISFGIPVEVCEKWHINRLIALIRTMNTELNGDKKLSRAEIMRRNKILNERRKKEMNTSG